MVQECLLEVAAGGMSSGRQGLDQEDPSKEGNALVNVTL